jgi:hypothetical protein
MSFSRGLTDRPAERSLLIQRSHSNEHEEIALKPPQIHTFAKSRSLSKMAAPAMSSRMSIERYLKAPLSDEPASAPAINDAIRKHIPREWIDSPATLYNSRETSVDVHSDGRPTFFTSGSVPETVDTSYTTDSKSNPHRRALSNLSVALLDTQGPKLNHTRYISPDVQFMNSNLSPIVMAKEWAEKVEQLMPGNLPNQTIDHRAKAEAEILKIQEKAKELELMMRQFRIERNDKGHSAATMTDDSARQMMAANPKLAWILGGDTVDGKNIARPKTVLNTTDDVPDSPRSFGMAHNIPYGRSPRKSKSNGALDDAVHRPHPIRKAEDIVEQQLNKQPKFHCTFCQKRCHTEDEWIRHEKTIHMPEELWVCCPRTGEFPTRCPFCEKNSPSPAHLADHNFISCQEKPLAERTFRRKDHFLLHISQVHSVSPSQKPARLTELENAWRHPLPMKIGHQALHCGFCGMTFRRYQERTMHVSRHFSVGADMMSWWKHRINHNVSSPETNVNTSNP